MFVKQNLVSNLFFRLIQEQFFWKFEFLFHEDR